MPATHYGYTALSIFKLPPIHPKGWPFVAGFRDDQAYAYADWSRAPDQWWRCPSGHPYQMGSYARWWSERPRVKAPFDQIIVSLQ